MVEPKLDRRYRTAARLLEDLQNLNVALPESRPFRIDKRLWLAGGLTVLVGLAGLIGFMGWPGSLVSLSMGPAIQEALERSSAIRTNVTEYFITSSKLPNSNADLKLPQPSAYRSSLVESISILPNGFIETKLNRNAIKSGGTIYFKPLVNFETYFIEWKCLSPDIKQIAKIAQICTYEPGFSLK